MTELSTPGARVAMALVSAVVLVVQIAATRLLSATVAYHAAFAVIALVMLALAGSAASVYRARSSGSADATGEASRAAALGAPLLVATALAYVAAGAVPLQASAASGLHFVTAGVGFYAVFHACGLVVAWLLSAWPRDIGRVYFADLAGAAAGCLVAVPLLSLLAPVPLLCVCAVVLGVVALVLGGGASRGTAVVRLALVLGVALVAIARPELVRLRSAKAVDQSAVLFEKWNALARVTVSADAPGTAKAIEILSGSVSREEAVAEGTRLSAGWWGMGTRWAGRAPESLWIELDTDAGTQILRGGGTDALEGFEALQWDVTSVAYWLRPGGLERTFVIGGGGGRDFLTALTFGARAVDVVELNPLVVHAVEERFPEWSGRPYSRAGVHYRVGDARSELSRSDQRYDLIQMSMIDTWAASMSGALTLSENALYTREAFSSYLDHLGADGIFTVSRWYTPERHAEAARVITLMGAALAGAGAADPAAHIAVVSNPNPRGAAAVATCLMKRSPFTEADLATLRQVCADKGFQLLWPSGGAGTPGLPFDVRSLAAGDYGQLSDTGYDVSPTTDDRPFFFYLGVGSHDASVPILFGCLLLVGLAAGQVLVFAPLREVEAARPAADRVTFAGALPETTYFFLLGVSFLAVELGVLQRYIVFLGHPSYALSVVLCSLLVSTALGSLLSDRRPGAVRVAFPGLLAGLAATAFAVPPLLESLHGQPLAVRIAVSALLILPLGAAMGTALPTGMRLLAEAGRPRLVPWMWAVNGLSSTLASVAGMAVAMEFGYTALLVLAMAGYATAWSVLGRFPAAESRAQAATDQASRATRGRNRG